MTNPAMRVKVAHRDILVLPLSAEGSEGLGACGVYEGTSGTIFVSPVDPPEQACILLHELLHAIWAIYALPPRIDEETACGRLDMALAALIRDNPFLVARLSEALEMGMPIVGEASAE